MAKKRPPEVLVRDDARDAETEALRRGNLESVADAVMHSQDQFVASLLTSPAPITPALATTQQAGQALRYSVISDVNLATFCKRVEAAVAEGWRLQGGVLIAEYFDPIRGVRCPGWHQAMVMGG